MRYMNRLVVAIVVWNNADDAIECAISLLSQKGVEDYTILFVDNASKVTEIEKIKHFMAVNKDPRLKITSTGENGGTAGGFTAAAKWAKDNEIEYVGSINADAIADTQWLSSLYKEITTHPDTAIVTGKVLHRDGKTIDSTGDFYTTWGLPAPRGRGMDTGSASNKSEYIFGATGGAYLARTEMYDNVGYYDRSMFMYYEDVDLSFRAQLSGYRIRYVPDAIVYHKRGASSETIPGLVTYHTFKNLPLLFTKNVPLGLWPTIFPRFLLGYSLILGNALVHRNGLPAVKGCFMSFILTPQAIFKRLRIQYNRKVNTDYISSIILHDIPQDQTGLRKFRELFTGAK